LEKKREESEPRTDSENKAESELFESAEKESEETHVFGK
jgi:hypothetical protein